MTKKQRETLRDNLRQYADAHKKELKIKEDIERNVRALSMVAADVHPDDYSPSGIVDVAVELENLRSSLRVLRQDMTYAGERAYNGLLSLGYNKNGAGSAVIDHAEALADLLDKM